MNITHIHLDAIGGVAGDMFVGALLDLRPDLMKKCNAALKSLRLSSTPKTRLIPYKDKVLRGKKFEVQERALDPVKHHTPWSSIRNSIETSRLDESTKKIALEIFELLASAEAKVHGIKKSEVAFHEVGGGDSIADIIFSAVIINELSGCVWSIGAIPRGAGLVKCEHGYLPLPAPATAILLEGFLLVSDEEEGERVTPTGAAILRYLRPDQAPCTLPLKLIGSGIGFGSRKFTSRSNILRVTAFEQMKKSVEEDVIEILRFEIDDQNPEDLALAVDTLRKKKGVIDICQWPVFGKKSRISIALQVLVKQGFTDDISKIIFDETTTLGIRHMRSYRKLVKREIIRVGGAKVKLASRPSRITAKAEIENFRGKSGRTQRLTKRKNLEEKALRGRNANAK